MFDYYIDYDYYKYEVVDYKHKQLLKEYITHQVAIPLF